MSESDFRYRCQCGGLRHKHDVEHIETLQDEVDRLAAEVELLRTKVDRAEGKTRQVRMANTFLHRNVEELEKRQKAIREALGGYEDSDLVSLAETMQKRLAHLEKERDEAREMYGKLTNRIFEEWCELFLHKQWAYVSPDVAIEDIIGWLKKEAKEVKDG